MSGPHLTPLGPRATEVLRAEARRADGSAEQAERVFARLSATLAFPGAGGAGGAGGGSGGGTDGGGAPSPALPPPAGGSAALAPFFAKAAPWIATAFLAGTATGALAHATLAPHPTAMSSQTERALATAPVPKNGPEALEAISVEVLPRAPSIPVSSGFVPAEPTASVASPGGHVRKDADLERERLFVERARMALARGQWTEALEALDAHASAFPTGRMTEEREALSVHALASAGRTSEAERRATRFRVKFPQSLFLPVMNTAAGPQNDVEREK